MRHRIIAAALGVGVLLAGAASAVSASGSLALSNHESATVTCSGGEKPRLSVSGERIGRHDTSREFTLTCVTK